MARRLRYDEKSHLCVRSVHGLMRLSWSNLQSVSWPKAKQMPVELHCQLALQHIEELSCMRVEMPLLRRARRHSLFYDAEVFAAHEMPSVAGSSPGIMVFSSSLYRFPHQPSPD